MALPASLMAPGTSMTVPKHVGAMLTFGAPKTWSGVHDPSGVGTPRVPPPPLHVFLHQFRPSTSTSPLDMGVVEPLQLLYSFTASTALYSTLQLL